MEELINSVKSFLHNRATSPLFGSIVISWLICNYKTLIIIFSSISPKKKINLIDDLNSSVISILNIKTTHQLTFGYILPVALSIIYIYIYPLLSKPILKHSVKKQKELRDLKKSIMDSKLLTYSESEKILRNIEDLKSENEKLKFKHDVQLNELNESSQIKIEKTKIEYRNQIDAIVRNNEAEIKRLSYEIAELSSLKDIKDELYKPILDGVRGIIRGKVGMNNGAYSFEEIVENTHISESSKSFINMMRIIFFILTQNEAFGSVKLDKNRCRFGDEIYIISNPPELDDLDRDILLVFSPTDGNVSFTLEYIQQTINHQIDFVKLSLYKLQDLNFLTPSLNSKDETIYTATDKGLTYISNYLVRRDRRV